MTPFLEQGTANVLREAQALFSLPSLIWYEDAVSSAERLDPTTAFENLLRLTVGSCSRGDDESDRSQDAFTQPAETPRSDFSYESASPALASDWRPHDPRQLLQKEFGETKSDALPTDASGHDTVAKSAAAEPPREASRVRLAVVGATGNGPQDTRLITDFSALQGLFRSIESRGRSRIQPPDMQVSVARAESIPSSWPTPQSVEAGRRHEAVLGDERAPAPGSRSEFAPSAPLAHSWSRDTQNGVEIPAHPQLPSANASGTARPAIGNAKRTDTAMVLNRNSEPAIPLEEWIGCDADDPRPIHARLPATMAPTIGAASVRPDEREYRRSANPEAGASFAHAAFDSDPDWEESIFNRLLDRWEERLREQAIRHLGFTGGRF